MLALAQFSVAVAQVSPRLGDVAANFALYEERVAAARAHGADLVVFPELSLTGYFLKDMVSTVALQLDAPEVARLKELSRSVALVAGFATSFVRRVSDMIRNSQFKRRLPVIAKISNRTIDRDFRYARDWGK